MSKLNICIVGCVSKELRGPQRFVIEIAKWLSRNSIRGNVIYGSPKTIVKSIDIHSISMIAFEGEESALIRHLPSMIRSLLFSFLSFLKIIQLHKKCRFSIIHAQDANYGAMASMMASKLIHVPVVLHIHGINLAVIRLMIRPRWLARLYRAYYLFLQKELIKRSDCVICVSEDNKRFLPLGKKTVVPMGVNTTLFRVNHNSEYAREKLGIPKNAFTIGYVGALTAGKGLRLFLKSFYNTLREMPPETSAYLLIVGDGPERRGLEDLADELGVRQYLRLTGFRTDVPDLLDAMNIFVFPSMSEGSPIAILEAMAASKAIIASNIPAIREIVRDGEEAILVRPQNTDELKRAILLLYKDRNLRVELGHKAKERAKLYDAKEVYGRLLKVYKELAYRKELYADKTEFEVNQKYFAQGLKRLQ